MPSHKLRPCDAARFFLCLFTGALAASAQTNRTVLAQRLLSMTQAPGVAHNHWGIIVTTLDGKPVFTLNETQLFQPASNAKLFTTAAGLALLKPSKTFQTQIVSHGTRVDTATLDGSLYLIGGGDGNLFSRSLPYTGRDSSSHKPEPLHDLAELADQVAASGLKIVRGDVVGDDRLFPFEPYASDWTIEDAVWGYGAPVSALSIHDNQIVLSIRPGPAAGSSAFVSLEPTFPYYTIENALTTGPAKSANTIHIERSIGSKTLRLFGSIAVGAPADTEEIAIEDPAEYAAMAFTEMLAVRGVTIQGRALAQHLLPSTTRGFLEQTREPLQIFRSDASVGGCFDAGRPELEPGETLLAEHRSAPLEQDVTYTNKESQNLHAELMLRALGREWTCTGSIAQGARVLRQFLLDAGLEPSDFVFFDGSGLSGHDLVSPRATARLLQYAVHQPWFPAWKASLPVGGVDGSLEHRFAVPPLKGHVFAKTGTLGEARALSGYLDCASGRTLIFSIFVGNHLPGTSDDREVIDRIVATIAAEN
jgi:D-alanyl-D-alanine carboxypeptidase/D-alanyl-D-alanine-endopeptidase (penicillin-binding protein 4)